MNTVSKNRQSIRNILYIALFAAVISVCSWISIPTTVPFTLQTMAVCIAAGLLGPSRGVTAVAVYLALGAIGVPVYSGFGHGMATLFGSTGGYLFGFLLTALLVGLAVKLFGRKWYVLPLAMIVGIAACYLFGTLWFQKVYVGSDGNSVSLSAALSMCVIPFIVPDLAKIAVATVVVNRVSRVVKL
jgi:biotin transport system substrate-specific component